MKKQKNKKHPKPITTKLPKPMSFDEVLGRIVRVKPPQDKKQKDVK